MILVIVNDKKAYDKNKGFAFDLIQVLQQRSTRIQIKYSECDDINDPKCLKTKDGIVANHVFICGSQFNPNTPTCPPGLVEKNVKLIKTCERRLIPVLAICFGCEVLNITYGGTLRKRTIPHYGEYNVIVLGTSSLLPHGELFKKICVHEAHDYCLDIIPDVLEITGAHLTENGDEVAMLKHRTKNIFGMQFHPERSRRTGMKMIDNFLLI